LIRLLLDEHVSPSLVGKLGDKGAFAVAAAHVGLSGEPDEHIWNYCASPKSRAHVKSIAYKDTA
jgi:predicted nuclease of predicted toxin-antitoxin system